MRSLVKFLANNCFFLLFLLLEVISIRLVIEFNNYQRVKFLSSSNLVTGWIYDKHSFMTSYLSLRKTNDELADENALLKNLLLQADYNIDTVLTIFNSDSTRYSYISARIIKNTVSKQNNTITLNKGKQDGVLPDMGVVGTDGIVGVITHVSDEYSTGYSVLNTKWAISAKLKKSDNFGSLVWDGKDHRIAKFKEVLFHVELAVGDTIVTSGLTPTFPEGVMIGTVESFDVATGNNFYDINVKLFSDFTRLTHVCVVLDKDRQQITELESTQLND